jgi:ferritin-like metal-binding protein YciE
MEKMNDLNDLLKHEIQDLYSVEEQIIEAMPAMIEKAGNKTLKKALNDHLKITQEHKNRLDKVKKILELGAEESENKGFLSSIFGGGKHVCKGMQGIIDEGDKIMNEDMTPQVLDAAIIACAQKIEHYEICGYGTARTYARELGLAEVQAILEKTLNEEYHADDQLTALAVQRINIEAGLSEKGTGDHSASGSVSTRSGKQTSRSRASEVMELEEVRSSAKGERKNASHSKANGKPRAAASTRSSTGREPASKRTSASTRTTSATKSTRGSERTGTTGRSGSSGRSRA